MTAIGYNYMVFRMPSYDSGTDLITEKVFRHHKKAVFVQFLTDFSCAVDAIALVEDVLDLRC